MNKRKGFKIPEVLTENEQTALLAQPNPRYLTGQRNQLMLKLMLDTGLRLSEATALRWKDIDLDGADPDGTTLMVRQGKGRKDRKLWIGAADVEILRRWKARQAEEIDRAVDHIFTTLQGKPVSGRYVQQMVKRYAARAGIDKHIHPHTLRHSFATDLYRDTTNIRLTQKALGHSNLATTQIYTHIVDEELEGAMKSFRQPVPAIG